MTFIGSDLQQLRRPQGRLTASQKIRFRGLSRGKDDHFRVRVRALGANGPSGWSDVATLMVV